MTVHRHVLVILAHPDDETFGSGGEIALYTQAGIPVTYVCATKGELGRNMGRPIFATRESLPLLREQELRNACDILGVKDLRFLGIRDKAVEFVDPAELALRLRAIIDELNPSLVLTFYPGYGVHPDHNAIGAAAINAIKSMDPAKRPIIHAKAFGPTISELGAPEEVDISSVVDIKLAATKAHASQSQGMLAAQEARFEKDPTLKEQWERDRLKERHWVITVD